MNALFTHTSLIAGLIFSNYVLASAPEDAPVWSTPERTAINWHEPEASEQQTVEGSAKRYTLSEIDDKYSAPDWFPNRHAPMPKIVQYGKGKKVWACASCHLASGMGHPESARLAGLSSEYMQAQMRAFASGERKDYSGHMNRMASLMTTGEIKEVSDWFAQLKPIKWYDVVENHTVPRTVLDKTRMRIEIQDADMQGNTAGFEPIAGRIIELPKDLLKVKLRSPNDGFIAYVQPGSINEGKRLATTVSGTRAPCITCHGVGLLGTVIAPNIAGLSPIYVVRQLYGFKLSKRKGDNADKAQMMSQVSKSLNSKEIYALAAYLATLSPTE